MGSDVHIQAGTATAHFGVVAGRPVVMHGIAWLAEGYRRALARFREASERNDRSPIETFVPVFEALNWAASAEEGLRVRLGADTRSAPFRGLRFVRNRVHHQWADAIRVEEYQVESWVGPIGISGMTFDWFWKPVENLPDAERTDTSGETAYVNDLADKPVRDALNAVEAFLAHHRL